MRSPTTALLEGTPLTSGYFRWQKGLSGPGPGPGPATDPLPQDLRRSGCPAVEALTLSKHPKGWLHGLRFNPGIATCRGLTAGPDRPITLQETQWRHRPPTGVPAQHGQIMLSCWNLPVPSSGSLTKCTCTIYVQSCPTPNQPTAPCTCTLSSRISELLLNCNSAPRILLPHFPSLFSR